MQQNRQEALANQADLHSAADQNTAAGAVQRLLDRPLTDDDLASATRQVSQPLEETQKQVRRLLLFRVSGEDLALAASAVAGVIRSASVHRVPHRSNKIVRGLCNVEGDLLLCGDLAALLQLSASESQGDDAQKSQGDDAQKSQGDDAYESRNDDANESRRMIVVGDDLERWVVEADSVQGVVQVVPDTFRQPPVTVDAALGRYTSHLVPLEKGCATLIDHKQLAAGFQAALS